MSLESFTPFTLREMDCNLCGEPATLTCPKCGKIVCELCLENPCENGHKEEEERWETELRTEHVRENNFYRGA